MAYDPPGDIFEHLLHVSRIIADHNTRDGGVAMVIVHLDLGHGNVEFLVQASKQRFERPPLILQRIAGG